MLIKKTLILLILVFLSAVSAEDAKSVPGGIAKVGETIEISVPAEPNIKYEWDDSGAGGNITILDDSSKIKWTAPAAAPKKNPAVINVRGKDANGNVVTSGVRNIVVFGGEIVDQPILFYCDGSGPARIFKSAPNQVKEVKYKWEVVGGSENIGVIAEDIYKAEAKFKAKKPSGKKDDTEVKLTYNIEMAGEKKSYEAAKKLTIHFPKFLKVVSTETRIEEGPELFGYSTVAGYQILNQFEEPMNVEGIVLQETLRLVSNPMKVPADSINFRMPGFVTDIEGKFTDKKYIFQSFPVPGNFELVFWQEIIIRDCVIRKNELKYKKDMVEIKENKDIKGTKEIIKDSEKKR